MIEFEFNTWRVNLKKIIFAALALTLAAQSFAQSLPMGVRVAESLDSTERSLEEQARDRYRHPVATLDFFGLEDGMSVMEIWPSGGWYAKILAPVMNGNGQYIQAIWDPEVEGQPGYRYSLPEALNATFANNPGYYGEVETVHYSPPESASLGEADSVDMILTFRSIHGLVNSGDAQAVFNEFARVLKPGGTLGVVQHRADAGTDPEVTAKKGYVSEEAVIAMAEKAGLSLSSSSEINANPKDTKDYADGVWTLPPSYRLGDTDREKYSAIGESDRMTLRFEKPAD